MTDPQHPPAGDEERDEGVASLLEVEQLDDVTRRRLVDTALRSAPSRPWARYAVAAAIVLALVGGGAALLVGQSGGHQTASRAPGRPPGAALSPAKQGPLAAGAAAPTPVPRFLGDYGDLGDPSNLARLAAATKAPGSGQRAPADLAPSIAAARACANPTMAVTAFATGTTSGRPTVVLVAGGRLLVVLLSPCELRPLAP